MPATATATTSTTAAANTPRRFQCRHIFTDGHRCGSPCLRHEAFCFYHHASRGRAAVPSRPATPTRADTQTIDLSQGEHRAAAFLLPTPEDRGAIQHAIGEILNRLANNELDPRRAGLLLYGLQIASLNLAQSKPGDKPVPTVEEIVTDPELGTLAPETEIDPPGQRRRTLTEMLLAEILSHPSRKPRPDSTQTDPTQTDLTQTDPTLEDDLDDDDIQIDAQAAAPTPPRPHRQTLLPGLHAAAILCHLRPHPSTVRRSGKPAKTATRLLVRNAPTPASRH